MSQPFIGEIVMFGGNFAPRSWAFCDGQLLPIASNTALFSILGTTYGGDGRTTFGLPDLRGRVAMHPGNGPGLTPRSLGQKSGVENVTLTTQQIPSHNHNMRLGAGDGNQKQGINRYLAVTDLGNESIWTDAAPASATMNTAAISQTGGSQEHTNIQPFLCVNFIIALQGLFPSRN